MIDGSIQIPLLRFANQAWNTCGAGSFGNTDPKFCGSGSNWVFTHVAEHEMYDLIMLLVIVGFGDSHLGMNKFSRYHANTRNKAVFGFNFEVEQ